MASGLHYTEDGSLLDVWHWKSVRTGPLGQIDDNFFGPPLAPPESAGARYTAGYSKDPKTGGGFTMNWESFDPDGVVPRWLPKDPAVLARMGEIDLDPAAVDQGDWWISQDLLVPYSAERDAKIPVAERSCPASSFPRVFRAIGATSPRSRTWARACGVSKWPASSTPARPSTCRSGWHVFVGCGVRPYPNAAQPAPASGPAGFE